MEPLLSVIRNQLPPDGRDGQADTDQRSAYPNSGDQVLDRHTGHDRHGCPHDDDRHRRPQVRLHLDQERRHSNVQQPEEERLDRPDRVLPVRVERRKRDDGQQLGKLARLEAQAARKRDPAPSSVHVSGHLEAHHQKHQVHGVEPAHGAPPEVGIDRREQQKRHKSHTDVKELLSEKSGKLGVLADAVERHQPEHEQDHG